MPLGKIVPRPPRPDPSLVPQSVHGNRPHLRDIDWLPPRDISHQDFTVSIKWTWRHVAFFFAVVACIGIALMIVYGGVR